MGTEAQERTVATPEDTVGLVERMAVHMRQFVCGLHGHDALLHYGPGRLSLQCTSCGYESPGWDVNGEPGPSIVRKPRILQMPLVRQRRVA